MGALLGARLDLPTPCATWGDAARPTPHLGLATTAARRHSRRRAAAVVAGPPVTSQRRRADGPVATLPAVPLSRLLVLHASKGLAGGLCYL